MKTVKEVSCLSGISVRTLHYYDEIGLLKPTSVTDAGYRLYDDSALARLQSILLFRELQFPLKDIITIIDSPDFDKSKALSQQIELLELQKKRISELIAFARNIQTTGVNNMDFKPFDKTEIEKYEAEAKKLWGKTDAYAEFEQKNKNVPAEKRQENSDKLMNFFTELGKIKHLEPGTAEVQTLVGSLRAFISENYYNCTVQIFRSLGMMYNAGGEMTENIDKAGGEGTADFASKAIEIYCDLR